MKDHENLTFNHASVHPILHKIILGIKDILSCEDVHVTCVAPKLKSEKDEYDLRSVKIYAEIRL